MKQLSEEHKRRIGDALRGKPKSVEHIAALIANHPRAMAGRKQSEKFREVMRRVHVGKTISPESIAKAVATRKRNGKPNPRKGKKVPERSGPNHHNWKGGKSSENVKICTSLEYVEWRRQVFKRDGWKCVKCGYRSTTKVNGKSDIQADHIRPFADYPELRFDVANGRTLCLECHKVATEELGLRKRGGRPKKEPASC